MDRLRRIALVVAIPVVILSLTACPGLIVDHIAVTSGSTTPLVGSVLTFTCISPTDNAVQFQWDFGDDTTATGPVVSHQYSLSGTFTVTCNVITENGSVLTFTTEIVIVGWVAYRCGSDTCIVNIDGSNNIMLNNPAVVTGGFDHVMNGLGRVVWSCKLQSPPVGVHSNQICAVDADGSDFLILTSFPTVGIKYPIVNNLGQIVFECPASGIAQVCIINDNGTGFQQLTSGSTRNRRPYINDLGQIAYNCVDASNISQVCVMSSDGSGKQQLTNFVNNFLTNIGMNNAGQIAHGCNDGSTSQLCITRFDGSVVADPITNIANASVEEIHINNNGQISFLCDVPSTVMCAINADGSGFKDVSTPNVSGPEFNSINDSGLIAIEGECDGAGPDKICIVDFEGNLVIAIPGLGGADVDEIWIR